MLDDLDHQAKSADVRTAIENERSLEQAHQKLVCEARATLVGTSTTHADEPDEGTSVDACEAKPLPSPRREHAARRFGLGEALVGAVGAVGAVGGGLLGGFHRSGQGSRLPCSGEVTGGHDSANGL